LLVSYTLLNIVTIGFFVSSVMCDNLTG